MQKFTALPRSATAAAVRHSHSYAFKRSDRGTSVEGEPGGCPAQSSCIPQPVAQAASPAGPAVSHPIAGAENSPFPYVSSLPSAPRAKTHGRLRCGIPRLDRFFEGGFSGGQIALLEGPVDFMLQLTTRFAVNGVVAFGRPVLFIDGGNTADPYRLAAVCRRWHLDARDVLKQILIARAFTVYQMDTLLAQMVEERVSALKPAVLIISSLNSMYLDPDVNWDEARVIFKNDLGTLCELTEKYGVVTLITNVGHHKSYHAMELGRTLRGLAGEHIDIRARSKSLLHLVKNGADTMDFRPLPAYQCSLDEFLIEGVMTDG